MTNGKLTRLYAPYWGCDWNLSSRRHRFFAQIFFVQLLPRNDHDGLCDASAPFKFRDTFTLYKLHSRYSSYFYFTWIQLSINLCTYGLCYYYHAVHVIYIIFQYFITDLFCDAFLYMIQLIIFML